MDFGINDKVALVTGAGGGLGGAIALALAREGARVLGADRNSESLTAVAKSISDEKLDFTPLVVDFTDATSLAEMLADLPHRYGNVDILVNNTGGPPPIAATEIAGADWHTWFNALVIPVVTTTAAVLPAMRQRRWGRIITSTSSGIACPIPNLALSNSLRASLAGWSKTLAAEIGRDGVTSNIVVPGRIATGRITALDEAKAARDGTTVEHVAAASTAAIPLGRYGDPAEYGAAVAFLASARASYITGSVVRVDGGLIPSI
ncbi:SDR family oxidoreductase [Mycobacterium montefiorense]|uniref:3-oxoacyl-[acyl-carrier-protein] reductase MabA n=1 Tax=Mycobacterium montefiorense TaxID=154654 RepID=A0AA37PL51_9MYCO|nr:SDR family oxidoreductase [Mycobacterium montefiorense]GBG40311.1 3-oxoacyl-ACP reductase [Mycobacterium montefiorense]GKU35164.1 3-oxoacyl-ACP reductase [Mycobacterium montefiorense]GKU40118.1 3-oxoacyl-ACP reductase [Mycobacterium montefiorense]GKU46057.1 3-oxoacyl-ACP reductase [Mycobacterium montefiorense]GKU52929.1 3-oxoacyl-ACP reductase [Mycobacterium montefiorense]